MAKVKLTSIELVRHCETPNCKERCGPHAHYCRKCHVARDRAKAQKRMRSLRSGEPRPQPVASPAVCRDVEISPRPFVPSNVPLDAQCLNCGARLSSVNVFRLCDGCRDEMTRVQVRDWALGQAVPEVRAVMAQFGQLTLTDEEHSELKALTLELQSMIRQVAGKIKNEK